jgi:hypothetical protein
LVLARERDQNSAWGATGRRKVRKNFLFEKKKQKTFAPALASPDVDSPQLARLQESKSFLVLFFKKRTRPSSRVG